MLLVVENDLAFAKVLLDAGRMAGFKGVVIGTGAGALTMAREFHPSVITLDIFLPDMQGWRILDRLKTDLATRHIPICVVSTDDSRERALQAGAIAFISKPLQSKDEVDVAVAELYDRYSERPFRNLVVAMPATPLRAQLLGALDNDIRPVVAEDVESVRAALADADCVVVDASFHDFGPEDVVEAMDRRSGIRQLPVVRHATSGSTNGDAWRESRHPFAVREADTLEKTLAQLGFLLHRNPALMSERERDAAEAVHGARGRSMARRRSSSTTTCGTSRSRHGARQRGDDDRIGRQWARGDPPRRVGARHRYRADGYHDAGDGWHHHDAGDP